MPQDRYVPDLSEVPPDPADPVPVRRRPYHMTEEQIAYVKAVQVKPFPLFPEGGPILRSAAPLPVTVSEAVWDMAAIDALIAEHKARSTLPPLTDAEIEAALEPLRRDIEQAGGRLEVGYEEPAHGDTEGYPLSVDAVIAAIEAAAPAPQGPTHYPLVISEAVWNRIRQEGTAPDRTAPPWPERDALIARQQAEVFERLAEPRGALTYPDAGRVWLPPRHGKSLGGAMTLADLMWPKEPPQLPPSPVVQAALVVDPEE